MSFIRVSEDGWIAVFLDEMRSVVPLNLLVKFSVALVVVMTCDYWTREKASVSSYMYDINDFYDY